MESTVESYNSLGWRSAAEVVRKRFYPEVKNVSAYSEHSNLKRNDSEVQYVCLYLRSCELSRELEDRLEALGASCIAAVATSKVYAVVEKSNQMISLLTREPEIDHISFEEPVCTK